MPGGTEIFYRDKEGQIKKIGEEPRFSETRKETPSTLTIGQKMSFMHMFAVLAVFAPIIVTLVVCKVFFWWKRKFHRPRPILHAERVTLPPFETIERTRVPYNELYQRRFASLRTPPSAYGRPNLPADILKPTETKQVEVRIPGL